AQYPEIFPLYYIPMVRAGEVSGRLEIILDRLANHLEKEQEITQKVKASLVYPALILAVGVLTVFILLTFVIPRLSVMFEDFDQQLPLVTLILMRTSGFFARYGLFIFVGCCGGATYLLRWFKTSAGKMTLDRFLLKVGILGAFIKTVEIGRFGRTLGTLVESGVPIVTALQTVEKTVANSALREEISALSGQVSQGVSLGHALSGVSFMPDMAVNVISVGEESGKLEKGLHKVADIYEREAENVSRAVAALLGPLVLIVVIALVGFVVIAMLLPILQINLLIK
ncbi:MAG: type II secretion system F family protein, partial [Candidatus Omnitrophica bacterium]|nr:type II secretion system F family protein [Candidatus Omnitrophota bacterium]